MSEFFEYKGYPLVRSGNTIYYGRMSDETVAMLQIQSSHKVKNLDVADKVKVTLMSTDTTKNAAEMIIKNCERSSLYEALDVANIWLNRN